MKTVSNRGNCKKLNIVFGRKVPCGRPSSVYFHVYITPPNILFDNKKYPGIVAKEFVFLHNIFLSMVIDYYEICLCKIHFLNEENIQSVPEYHICYREDENIPMEFRGSLSTCS